jgi:hypothetical protein
MYLSGYEKRNHRSHQRAICHMKLSIEAKVAAAVAVAFAVLSIGVIAQEQSERGTAGLSQMRLRGSENSVFEYGGKGENQLLAQY